MNPIAGLIAKNPFWWGIFSGLFFGFALGLAVGFLCYRGQFLTLEHQLKVLYENCLLFR